MSRGGRSSGGGGFRSSRSSSYSSRRQAPPPAASPKPAAPAPAASAGSSAAGYVGATVSDGFMWGFGSSIGHRIMDGIWGPRKFEVQHTTTDPPATAAPAAAAAAASSSACLVHALDFQDCVSQNSSDISKCQRLVDILNDCRRRSTGQVAVVEASG